MSRYQKGKTNLDFTEARDSEWQWHQLGPYASLHVAPDRQPIQHPTTQFFTGRMPFLPPNQQRQSSEGTNWYLVPKILENAITVCGVNEPAHRTVTLSSDPTTICNELTRVMNV